LASRRPSRIQAIVLDRTKLKEQDLILTMLSKTGAQVKVVGKGARKPGSRLAARTEFATELDCVYSEGRGLGIVSEAQIMDAHKGVRGDLERLSCASALLEVARFTSFEDVEDPFLYPILARALTATEEATDRAHLDLLWAAYTFKVLSHEGWRPVTDACVVCEEDARTRFSVLAGGAVCESCARDIEGAVPVTEDELSWIEALIGCTFQELMESPVDDQMAGWLQQTARQWASAHLDVRLKAAEFFEQI
jgi:DNA repair protein RecO (recombination protein O)